MSFYTSVVRYGNSMLYRGYDSNGKRVTRKENFSPKFTDDLVFVLTSQTNKLMSMYGHVG